MGDHPIQSLLAVAIVLLGAIGTSAAPIPLSVRITALEHNYYDETCPDVEKIVQKSIKESFDDDHVTLPALLRAYFHDCSNGCDASLLVAPTPAHNDTERTHHDNVSLAPQGFIAINKAKEALENNLKCKGKVSCADIFTIAARDVVVLGGGPSYKVELGRLDSNISKASKVHLPGPDMNLDQQTAIYKTMGLNVTDLVALSMAHSFGFAHCAKFSNRLYNFNSTHKQDPTLHKEYAEDLKKTCPEDPKKVDPNVVVRLDPMTPEKLDNVYYKNLEHGLGLLTSDQVLFQDTRTRALVQNWAASVRNTEVAFIEAMIKLGRNKVLTKDHGVIRKHCDRFNGE